MKKERRNMFLLFLTALIWGVAFVAQSKGGEILGPLTFNCIRSLIGAFVLVPVILVLDRVKTNDRKPSSRADWNKLIKGGIICGILLCVASNFQQVGINFGTAAGKAGFLTACYILIVPVLSLFLGKKPSLNVWIGVAIAIVALYLLCINESFDIKVSDVFVLLCSVCFSLQIMTVDHFSPLVDGVRLSCIQFLVCGLLTSVPMLIFEIPGNGGFNTVVAAFTTKEAWISILYSGVMSCGVAYTLQIVGQDGVNPTIASLIMSLESVVSVIAGMIILNEMLSGKEILGCVLLFIAIIIAQIKFGKNA